MKKISIFLMLMTILAPMSLKAQTSFEYTAAEGTHTNSFVPMYTRYCDYGFTSEFIIPASELSDLSSGSEISAMTFHIEYPYSFTAKNLTIKLSNTNLSSYSQEGLLGSSGTIVYTNSSYSSSSPVVASHTFTFNAVSSFTYTGGGLIVQISSERGGSYFGGSNSWYGVQTTTYQGFYVYYKSNSSSSPTNGSLQRFIPKTTFTYVAPRIFLNPESATIITGFTETFTATTYNATNPSIAYTSSNPSVATVSGHGTTAIVTAVAPGTATITAIMTYAGKSYTTTSDITVEDPHYCTPEPGRVDGTGMHPVIFGSGDYVVNNTTYPTAAPYYGNYSSMIGAYERGETASVEMSFYTNKYDYGVVIWVDWNRDCEFSDSEVVNKGISTKAVTSNGVTTPGTLTLSFAIPDTVAGDYRMRIGAADSYFNNFINGVATGLHSPCYSGNYTCFHDYTLRVISCPKPTNLAVSDITNNSATISWDGDADNYELEYAVATTYDFDDHSMQGWTTIDADNDGYDWVLGSQSSGIYTSSSSTSVINAHNGSEDLMCSGSFTNVTQQALTPDNYLVSPQVMLGGSISFWACAQDASYPAEHFGVAVSTTGNTSASDFTTIQEWTMTAKGESDARGLGRGGNTRAQGTWYQYTVDLSAYSGSGYVAIRHFNCNNQFIFLVDDIIIEEGTNPTWIPVEGTVTSPFTLTGLNSETRYMVRVLANCDTDGYSDWTSGFFTTEANECPAPTELNAQPVCNSAVLSWAGDQDSYNVRYRKAFFYEDFENGIPTTWTKIDADGDGNNWLSLAELPTIYPYYSDIDLYLLTAHNGSNAATSSSAYNNLEGGITALNSDHWLISPRLNLQGVLNFWVKGTDEEDLDSFEVLLSTTGNAISNFTVTLQAMTTTTYEYTEVSIDLSNYAGWQGYIAIHHVSSDKYFLIVDDFGLFTDWTTTTTNAATATISDLKSNTTYEWQVQGADCDGSPTDWSTSAYFTMGEFYTKDVVGWGNNNDLNYYLVSSPVGDIDPVDVGGLLTNSYDFYYFDQSCDLEWINYRQGEGSSNPGFNIVTGKGYLYSNEESVNLVFPGTGRTSGTETVELDYVTTAIGYTIDLPGWNLVGNPFAVNAWLEGDRGFYTMDVNGNYIAATNSAINPMEGIFVVATRTGESVTFTTAEPADKGPKLALNLSKGRNLIDRAIFRYDGGRQLPKLQFRQNRTKLYIPVNGQDYAIISSEEMGAVPVYFKTEEGGTYNLSLSSEEVSFAYLHLIDNKTGADIDLLQTPSYSFEAKKTDDTNRFKLVFATGDNSESDSFAFFSNGSFVINNEGDAMLQVIDVTGRIVKSENINGCANVNVDAASGVYMLRLINGNNVKIQKVVLR